MLKASQGPPPGHHLVHMRPGGRTPSTSSSAMTYAPAHGHASLPQGLAPTASNFSLFAPSGVMSVPVQPTGAAPAARASPIAVLPGQHAPPRVYSQELLPPAEAVPGPWFQAQASLPQHYQQYNSSAQFAYAPQGYLLPTSPTALVTPGRTPGRSPPPPPRQAYAAAAPAAGPPALALQPPGTARSAPPTAAAAYVAPVVFGSSSTALGSSSPPGARASARMHAVPPLYTATLLEGGDGGGSLVLSARSGGALSPGSGVNSGSRGSPSQARLGGIESPAPGGGGGAGVAGLSERERSKRDSPGHGAAARTRRRVAGAPDEPLSPPSSRAAADLDQSGRRHYLQSSEDDSEVPGLEGRWQFS